MKLILIPDELSNLGAYIDRGCEGIIIGLKDLSTNYEVELDRRVAIKKALDMINKDDVVLILGKGHEDYQIIGREKFHLDDAEEVRKYIEEHK